MTIKALLMSGLAAAAVSLVALPAAAHCKCACDKAHHKVVKTVKHKAPARAKAVRTKVVKATTVKTRVKTVVKVKTVVIEKPVIVERVVVVQAPPPPPAPSQVVYVDGVWCKKTVKVTYHREGGYSRTRQHYEGWRADHGGYGSRQVAYNGGW